MVMNKGQKNRKVMSLLELVEVLDKLDRGGSVFHKLCEILVY